MVMLFNWLSQAISIVISVQLIAKGEADLFVSISDSHISRTIVDHGL